MRSRWLSRALALSILVLIAFVAVAPERAMDFDLSNRDGRSISPSTRNDKVVGHYIHEPVLHEIILETMDKKGD